MIQIKIFVFVIYNIAKDVVENLKYILNFKARAQIRWSRTAFCKHQLPIRSIRLRGKASQPEDEQETLTRLSLEHNKLL